MSRVFLNLRKSLSFIDILIISGLSITHVNVALASCDDALKIPLNDSKKKILVNLLSNNNSGLGTGFSMVKKMPFDICEDKLALILKNNNQEIVIERVEKKMSSVNFVVVKNIGYQFFLEVDGSNYPLWNYENELMLRAKSGKCGYERVVIDAGGNKGKKVDLCAHNDHYSHYSSVR